MRLTLRACVALLVPAAVGCGAWAYAAAPDLPGSLPTAAERAPRGAAEQAARADVLERLDAWAEILRRGADGAVPPADLAAVGLDPTSPSLRWVINRAHRGVGAYVPGTLEVTWALQDVHVDDDGGVRASAYRSDEHELTPEYAEHDNQGEDGRELRLLEFEPGEGGLVLVSDVPSSWPRWAPWTDGREVPDAP